MCWWYEADDVQSYLDDTVQRLLEEGRESYRRLSLGENPVLAWCTASPRTMWTVRHAAAGIGDNGSAHRTLADARLTAELWRHYLRRLSTSTGSAGDRLVRRSLTSAGKRTPAVTVSP